MPCHLTLITQRLEWPLWPWAQTSSAQILKKVLEIVNYFSKYTRVLTFKIFFKLLSGYFMRPNTSPADVLAKTSQVRDGGGGGGGGARYAGYKKKKKLLGGGG